MPSRATRAAWARQLPGRAHPRPDRDTKTSLSLIPLGTAAERFPAVTCRATPSARHPFDVGRMIPADVEQPTFGRKRHGSLEQSLGSRRASTHPTLSP